MRTVTSTAFANMKFNKSKNFLIGITICLTTLLLYLIPSVGFGVIELQLGAVNKTYPMFHGLYRDVGYEDARKIKAAEKVVQAGFRCDAGYMTNDAYDIPMIFVDETCAELNKIELAQGHMPQETHEIVVSEGLLKAMGLTGSIGDTIRLPFQVLHEEGLDYTREQEFTICGMLQDNPAQESAKSYISYVAEGLIEEFFSKQEISYRVYVFLKVENQSSVDAIEQDLKDIGASFGVEEYNIVPNTEYLMANYVDENMVLILVCIMLVIVLAGMITIYSIYYVSMVHKVQEYGRLRAIGATKRQLRQMVFREGFFTALLAIPVGLLLGTLSLGSIFRFLYHMFSHTDQLLQQTILQMIENHEVNYYHLWIYLLAALTALLTVWFSLLKPMKIASRISPIEALRYQGEGGKGKGFRRGYASTSLLRLTISNLAGNKKRSLITILSMAATGIFFVAVATVLSCADPKESANASIEGQYKLQIMTEAGNKEHPEREWSQIQQRNPITSAFLEEIQALDGVENVMCFSSLTAENEIFQKEITGDAKLLGVPESYAEELEQGLLKGSVTYEELKKGEKVVLSEDVLNWYPDLHVGQKLLLQYQSGDEQREREVEIAGIGAYPNGLTCYAAFLTADEALQGMSDYNVLDRIEVFAEKPYDQDLEEQLKALCAETETVQMTETWQMHYETWRQGILLTSVACYAFLGILGIICIMNLINTMMNSIHVRKKELGMMQAVGLSEKQLISMLNLEGMFYTAGTLLCSIGIGSLAGYGMFCYAKKTAMFNITYFHYPIKAVLMMAALIFVLQLLLGTLLGKSLKRQSLVERIRFSE